MGSNRIALIPHVPPLRAGGVGVFRDERTVEIGEVLAVASARGALGDEDALVDVPGTVRQAADQALVHAEVDEVVVGSLQAFHRRHLVVLTAVGPHHEDVVRAGAAAAAFVERLRLAQLHAVAVAGTGPVRDRAQAPALVVRARAGVRDGRAKAHGRRAARERRVVEQTQPGSVGDGDQICRRLAV